MKSQGREEGLLSAFFLKFLNLQEAFQDVLGYINLRPGVDDES
jgi:hypothetical protein